ncbi:Panacea domain-containing protein [Acinetobacter baumannii]|uniref:Panacea domain-containing protein n=1 Tax=Acinetobacter baumannii TaxID=470 RepID=UPI0002AEA347|nr:type II toxin-antitoxin system antitoxin SocA domain-containing protein [Acinetobacter baumannii]ELW93680.1 PF13274 family protein [Acinetobacter baumannii AA-014]MBD0073966.1 DUF4065 domain-containing protein [Acinetobacter baumannii]MBD0088201.1 DUF4065 domain-containing protein [Acinetobacter baumannii]MBD0094058.1 DUF4065 domain-containing protein [Acinetobacter baumannii]MBD0116147.1 DUF4065 domain-containing protein [Acinetobacter baumannii]
MNNYKAMDIANYIIWYVNKDEDIPLGELTPLKLQKILYYVAANYLKNNDELLFDEPFQKWQYGPVVKEVYREFKSANIYHISKPKSLIEESSDAPFGIHKRDFKEELFLADKKFVETADPIIERLIRRKAFDLVEMTHREEAWSRYEPEINSGIQNLIYSLSELKKAKDI